MASASFRQSFAIDADQLHALVGMPVDDATWRKLLERGANANARDAQGNFLLHKVRRVRFKGGILHLHQMSCCSAAPIPTPRRPQKVPGAPDEQQA